MKKISLFFFCLILVSFKLNSMGSDERLVEFYILIGERKKQAIHAYYQSILRYNSRYALNEYEWKKIYSVLCKAIQHGDNFAVSELIPARVTKRDYLFCCRHALKVEAYNYLFDFIRKTNIWQNTHEMEYMVYRDLIIFKYLYNYVPQKSLCLNKKPHLILSSIANQPGPLDTLAINALLQLYMDEIIGDKKSQNSFFQTMEDLLNSQEQEKVKYAQSCLIQYIDKFNFPKWFNFCFKKDEVDLYEKERSFEKPKLTSMIIKNMESKTFNLIMPSAISVLNNNAFDYYGYLKISANLLNQVKKLK